MKIIIVCILMVSCILVATAAYCAPGDEIFASAISSYCKVNTVNIKATVEYRDSSGSNLQQQISNILPLAIETQYPIQQSNVVSILIAQADIATKAYFTLNRSLYQGPTLVGKQIKLYGKVKTIDGKQYIEDGSVITSQSNTQPALVMLQTDLLRTTLQDGSLIFVTGTCNKETDGQMSIQPLNDTAIMLPS